MTTIGGRWSWPAFAAILALVAGVAADWTLLQRISLALFGLLVLCWLATALSIRALRAQGRSTTPGVVAGDRIVVRYELRNRGLWPLAWALLEPHGFSTLPVQGQFVAIGARARREIDVSLACPQRGRWLAGGCTMRIGDPFGLFERVLRVPGSGAVLVYPRPIPLPGLALPPLGGQAYGRRGGPLPQPSAAIRDVRPYQPGDLPSRIHWLSSARLDTLMVKEPEGEPAAHAWLILDLEEVVQYGEDAGDSAELVIGAACTVLQHVQRLRIPAGLLAIGPHMLIAPEDRPRGHERLHAALATVTTGPHSVQPAMRLLRQRGAHNPGSPRGTVVAITPWADDRWTSTLPQLARAGTSVLCVLLDTPDAGHGPALGEQAAALRAAGIRVYRHTAWAR